MLDAHFWTTTRGRVLTLLRREPRTVDELATALELTDNAVRLHLAALEQSGLVRAAGQRHDGTVGKPATVYEVDPAGEPQLSRAYAPVLATLLAVLGERLPAPQLRAVMRDVGRRLAPELAPAQASLAARVAAASAFLNELGGMTAVERAEPGVFVIRGCGCPLAAAVDARGDVCVAVRTLLSEAVGAAVHEQCDRTTRANCCFEIRQTA